MRSGLSLAIPVLALGACAVSTPVGPRDSVPVSVGHVLATGCPDGKSTVTVVGTLEYFSETSRSILLDTASGSGARQVVGIERVSEISRKKELFDGNRVAVTGQFECELGPERDNDGLPLLGRIVRVSKTEVLGGKPRNASFAAMNLRPANQESVGPMKQFAEEWFGQVRTKNLIGVAKGLGRTDEGAGELDDSDSRRTWILFSSPNSLSNRLARDPVACGVYEYQRQPGIKGHAYCFSEDRSCDGFRSEEGRVAGWLGIARNYCVQIGSSESGDLWMSDAAAY